MFSYSKTIESITAPIGKIVAQLETHASVHATAAAAHDAVVKEAAELANLARAEVTAAKNAAAKFAALLS